MENKQCLIIGLALAGVLLLAGTGLAQNRGGGGPGSSLCTGSGPGGGVCAVTPAPTTDNQNCPTPGAGKSQKRGMRGQGGGQANQPTPQATPPAAGQ